MIQSCSPPTTSADKTAADGLVSLDQHLIGSHHPETILTNKITAWSRVYQNHTRNLQLVNESKAPFQFFCHQRPAIFKLCTMEDTFCVSSNRIREVSVICSAFFTVRLVWHSQANFQPPFLWHCATKMAGRGPGLLCQITVRLVEVSVVIGSRIAPGLYSYRKQPLVESTWQSWQKRHTK